MFFYRNIELFHKKRIYFIKHKVWHIKHEFKVLNEITHKISCQYSYECYTARMRKFSHMKARKAYYRFIMKITREYINSLLLLCKNSVWENQY